MSERGVTKFLQALGLSKREIQIYMFLARSGVQSTSFAAKRLKMERVQAYRTFRKLQEKGFIEATIERPTRFSIIPFENLLDSFIESRKSEVESLSQEKEKLLSAWRDVGAPETEYTVAKFSIITGKKKIHLKMLNMVKEAEKTISVLTTGPGLVQEDVAGVFDSVKHPLRIITEISPENLNTIERMDKRFTLGKMDVECRHMPFDSKLFPRFLIKDDDEAILYAMSGDKPSALKLDDEGLWINDKMFISVLKGFFEQMWNTATDATQRA
ncbi:MAG TPA: helix-turn-helix domain-containing protein, partial [Candidatus Bathyarchaeia archaeon]